MSLFRRLFLIVLLLLVFVLSATARTEAQPYAPPQWDSADANGDAQIHLYFFWSLTCPHCQEAHPFITDLPNQFPWLVLHSHELSQSQKNGQLYTQMAASVGQEAMYVPAFVFCGQMIAGYDTAEGTGAALVQALQTCQAETQARYVTNQTSVQAAIGVASAPTVEGKEGGTGPSVAETISIPLLGQVDAASVSLPAFTLVIAMLDAFNPCAFFVLMFLLSLMVHARSRSRMMLIGAIFVLFSGLIYFVFMAAWLNVFLWLGELQLVTTIAGLIAVVMALINIKDYFWFKQGVSLSIPASAKPSIFQRARGVLNAGSLPAMMASTVVLAIAANSYELLCTSGFPMIYTRALTLHDMPAAAFYSYLALYNLVYVLPLLLIVGLFAYRFGARKLSEQEGRLLKLMSGLMMLMLGVLLLVAPHLLSNLTTALLLLGTALLITWTFNHFSHERSEAKPQKGRARRRVEHPVG